MVCYIVKVLKRFPRVEYYFMFDGHIKFSLDRHLTQQKNFQWRSWKTFLAQYFTIYQGIRDRHVIIESEGPYITVKENIEFQARQVKIMKEDIVFNQDPLIIEPNGLSQKSNRRTKIL